MERLMGEARGGGKLREGGGTVTRSQSGAVSINQSTPGVNGNQAKEPHPIKPGSTGGKVPVIICGDDNSSSGRKGRVDEEFATRLRVRRLHPRL